ncbi:KGK domain-containing protein [Trichocoleus sp. FACHB-262]|uniref:KGK domain-containing protein n=1 Tax=Trichocoleus sp. FACHB-262 TaxID=2692869 RepID=UPI0016887FF5|nr:KGK domain-containing protein [Trichocoleus sp. FACHB-262]MBD2119436.1 hypothetical protein [Trichocoleus sp. FACHB-262]
MSNDFRELNTQSLDKDAALMFSSSMFKVEEFLSKIQETFPHPGYQAFSTALNPKGGIPGSWRDWFSKGIDCEILRTDAKGWKKGKLRIRIAVEFCPDEAEEVTEGIDLLNEQVKSSLDNIRQMQSH